MRVDFFLIFELVQIFEFHSDVSRGVFKRVGACIFGEADGQWTAGDFFFKQIFLVQEKNYGGGHEPFAVADRVKEFH